MESYPQLLDDKQTNDGKIKLIISPNSLLSLESEPVGLCPISNPQCRSL